MVPLSVTNSLKHTKPAFKARQGELAALKESEQRFRALVAASFDVVFRISPDWREMRHLVGKEFVPDTDNPNTSWLDLYIHPDDQPHMLAVINEAIRTKGTFDLEHRVLRVDGTLGWTHSRAIPILAADGGIVEWFGMASDITARKRMEEELRRHRENLAQLVEERTEQLARSERHYRTLVENLPDVVSRYDRDLRYIYRSPQQNAYTADLEGREVIGKTWAELGIPAARYGPWQDKYREALDTGSVVDFETGYLDIKGGLANFLVRVVPEKNGSGQVESLLEFTLDITARKRMESELLRLDRLNIVGEMAAAIGHEVRNPLTTVRGYLQMLQRRQAFEGHREQFGTMIGELDRANTIISDFLSLAKNKTVELKRHNLNDVVNSLQPLLQSEAFRAGQELKVDIADIPAFAMDEKEIRQLLLNLSNNAFHAMEPGGTLTIATGAEKGRVVLTVRDTGHGIPPEVLEKLGTPFVTTKENGTGLGLPVCYRIVERHGGKIDVKTSPAGTTFTIRFKPKQ